MPPGAPRDGYLLMWDGEAVGVWKKVPFKVTVQGQDHETPFLWLDPERGNRQENLKPVTGWTVGGGGYLRFPRKFQGVKFNFKNFHRLLLENVDSGAHAGHGFVAHHIDENRCNNVLANLEFMTRRDHFEWHEVAQRRRRM